MLLYEHFIQEVYLCGKMPIKSEITMAENLQKGCHIANKFNFISCLQLSGKKWIFHVDLICNQYYFLKRWKVSCVTSLKYVYCYKRLNLSP